MARFLISLRKDSFSDQAEAAAAIESAGVQIIKSFSFGLTYLVEAELSDLQSMPAIRLIEESDKPLTPKLHSDDSHLSYLLLDSSDSYNPKRTGSGQVVYLLDTGIRSDHPEFNQSLITNLYSNYTDVSDVSDFDDEVGHGTATASLIVGANQGAARGALLKNIKLFNSSSGDITVGEIIQALDVVLQDHLDNNSEHAKVVCMPWTVQQNDFIDEKITEMDLSNLVVVCAAGNDGVDVNTKSPAGVDSIITVGAFDRQYQVTSFTNTPWDSTPGSTVYTNYGAELDIFSLGTNIVAAGLNSDYITVSGTSFSASLVSAVACHFIEQYPLRSSREIKDIMLTEGHSEGINKLVFDQSNPDIDYTAVYKSIALTENQGEEQLTQVPSGRLFDIKLNTTNSINLGINPSATELAVLDFAPAPPWIDVDFTTGVVTADTTGLNTDLLPGIFCFAIRGTVNEDILVEEFSIGVFETDESELSDSEEGFSYYYDPDSQGYDQIVNYQVAPKF